MSASEQVVFMAPKAVNAKLAAIAKRLGVSKSWVARRLVLLGLEREADLMGVGDTVKRGRGAGV